MKDKNVPPSVGEFAVGERDQLLARVTELESNLAVTRAQCDSMLDANASLATLKQPSAGVDEPEAPVGYVSGERVHAEHERLRECRKERDTLRTANQRLEADYNEACEDAMEVARKCRRLEGEVQRLRAFANAMVAIAFDGSDADGSYIQEVAEANGLIKQKTMTEPCCGPDDGYCSCAYNSGFPTACYQRTATLSTANGEVTE